MGHTYAFQGFVALSVAKNMQRYHYAGLVPSKDSIIDLLLDDQQREWFKLRMLHFSAGAVDAGHSPTPLSWWDESQLYGDF